MPGLTRTGFHRVDFEVRAKNLVGDQFDVVEVENCCAILRGTTRVDLHACRHGAVWSGSQKTGFEPSVRRVERNYNMATEVERTTRRVCPKVQFHAPLRIGTRRELVCGVLGDPRINNINRALPDLRALLREVVR